ncbi:MAG: M28 family peptidase [Bacteroidales bacterium]|nr:M28 family peptidase [Bacteroidales bacterium]
MGGDTQIFDYDTIPSKIGGEFSYSNIYSTFSPASIDSSMQASYILLVAHYDSRYRQIVKGDTVFSYGAADDGYGLGVILESVSLALEYRKEWKQGIKVLFTDAEEHELDGMRSAWERDRNIFEGVNLVVNVEARGVRGPALLFETSPGNEKIIELYSYTGKPSGMSLTSAVYRFLPNDTDFSVVKDSIPGMNFAVIDNLKFYHTDLDNCSNISLASIQHYGDQLQPVIHEYLVNAKYSAHDALEGDGDVVFFTLPVLGLFAFSKGGYMVLNILICALFLFVLHVYVKYKMLGFKGILRAMRHILTFAAGAFVLGTAAAYMAAVHSGVKFSFIDLRYVDYDNYMVLAMLLVLVVWILVFCRLQERKDRFYAWKILLGVNIILMVSTLVLLVVYGEGFFLALPFATSSIALFFSIARNFKWLYLISASLTELLGVHFLYLLYSALTAGSLGVIMFLSVMYSFSIVSQYYCLKRRVL